MENQQQQVSERVKQRMTEQGVSQRELSRRCEIATSNLSAYLSGKKQMRADTLQRIADALGCDINLEPRA